MPTGFLPRTRLLCLVLLATLAGGARAAEHVDLLIRDGVIYDGRGGEPIRGDVAVKDGRVVASGTLRDYTADREVNANGLAVAPGFINTLSWAVESLIYDGRGMSDIKQGVTLEVFGEGNSMGPVNDRVREEMIKTQATSATTSPGRPSATISTSSSRKAFRRMLRRSSAPRPRASMWSATTMSHPRRNS